MGRNLQQNSKQQMPEIKTATSEESPFFVDEFAVGFYPMATDVLYAD